MVENTVEVVVDEALSKISGKSYLEVKVVRDGDVWVQSVFRRGASPQQISDSFNGTGCYIKYDDDVELPEGEKQDLGDLFIKASYNVPGL